MGVSFNQTGYGATALYTGVQPIRRLYDCAVLRWDGLLSQLTDARAVNG
jgi:hypothetical protein